MKKALLFAGLAAAFAFVGCNKEADVKGLDGRKVEIVLTNAQTRTVNEGMSTKWAEGDALNVFYAPAGTADYSDNVEFKVTDVATNTASGTAELSENAYDWYVLYPYSSFIKSPVNTSDGYIYIGSRSDQSQVQTGYDSMSHLAGGSSDAGFPVYGIVKNVDVNKVPVIKMKQVASVAAVKVKNDTDKAITITQVDFTAPEAIVGAFYVSFEEDPVKFTNYKYVATTASLTVKDAPELAPGKTATFYIGIKPFTAKAGDKLGLKVTADAGVVEKEVTLESAVAFESGVIKSLNIGYASAVVLPTITVSDVKATITPESTSGSPCTFEGKLEGAIVTFVSGSYAFIQDETGGIVLFKNGHGFNSGDKLEGVVSGSGYTYNGLKELTSLNVETITSGQTIPAPVELTLADLNANYSRYESVRVTVKKVTVPAAFSNRNTTMTDGEETLALRDQKNGLTITPGVYDITGYPSYYNAAQFGVWTQDDIVACDQPFFNAEAEEAEVSATTTSVKINVFGNVAWTAEASDGATLDKASGEGEGVINVSFAENSDTQNTKEYTVFVRTENTQVENNEFEINITQAKADAAGIASATIDFSEQGFENGAEVPSVTKDGVTATFDKGTGSNVPKYYNTGTAVRVYGGGTMTVSASGKTIVSVELTFGSGDQTNVITTDVQTYAEPTWTGEAGSVIFTVGGTTGHRRIKAITVKYNDTDAPVTAATLESIAVSGQTTTFTVGDTFSFDGTVTATYSDSSTKDVTSSATVSAPDMASVGTKEVTVSYTEGDVTKTASYTVTVNAAASHAGTAEDPFTVADALAATKALGEGNTSTDKYYIKGLISTVPESISNGRATYMISDDGSTVGELKVYSGYYIGNASFDSDDQLQTGDEVIVYGKLQYYKPSSGDSELEISGSYIESLKRGGAAQSAFSAKAGTSTVSANASIVKINVYGNVDWTASVTTPASVDVSSGNGQGVITVSIPENTDTENDRAFVATISSPGFDPISIQINQQKKEADNVIVIDGASLTSTATTEDTEQTFSGVTVVLSSGAKAQSSAGENRFTDKAILIGKNGAYIYNKTAIPGKIVKFEIYANKGASSKVTVGVNFSASPISAYNADAASTYTATLSTLDSVYDCTDKIPADAKYFWYQVTNANNSQVQFRITYE